MGCKFALAFVFAGIAVAADSPSFTKDVAPILNANCVSCHRPGEIAPMSLMTYEQVRPWARSIREKVSQGLMPPWHADEPHGTFLNDRRLSAGDKDTLLRWVDVGAPLGDPKDLPPAPQFADGWEIGTPDAIISMPKPFTVPAKGEIEYQEITMPTNFKEDKWVQAVEVRAGNRSVVHHILVFSNEPKQKGEPPAPYTQVQPKPRDKRGFGLGPGTLIATMAPGTNPMVYEPGTALLLKAGSTLTFQIHYTATGTKATDTSQIGFVFAKEKPTTEIRTTAFYNPMFTLPAGSPNTAVDAVVVFDQETTLWGIFPHTHLRGRSWEYQVTYPDGRKEKVLSVPAYDFNWQTYYMFAKPLTLPKGSRLQATARFDNSANNKWNPDPTVDVRWGEQTWEEMQYTGITYSVKPR